MYTNPADLKFLYINYRMILSAVNTDLSEKQQRIAELQLPWDYGPAIPRAPDKQLSPMVVTPPGWDLVQFDPTYNRTFTEVADERANELIEQAIDLDCKIILRYSGGCDSTMALCAILKNIPEEEKHRLAVTYTTESIYEHLWMFNHYVKDLPFIPYSTAISVETMGNNISLDGQHVDTFIGFDHTVYSGMAHKPWRESFPYLQQVLGDSFFYEKMEYLLSTHKDSPIPIVTVYEFMWWMAYNFQASGSLLHPILGNYKTRYAITNDLVDKAWIDDVVHNKQVSFFASHEMEKWMIHHVGKPEVISERDHKVMMKRYISDFTGKQYNQIKIGSGTVLTDWPRKFIAGITDDYKVITINDPIIPELYDIITNLNI